MDQDFFDKFQEVTKSMADEMPKSSQSDNARAAIKDVANVFISYLDSPDEFLEMIKDIEKSSTLLEKHLGSKLDTLLSMIKDQTRPDRKIQMSRLYLAAKMLSAIVQSCVALIDSHLVECYGSSEKYKDAAENANPLSKLISMFKHHPMSR